ncbi:MAG: hypothetical protein DDT31_00734 [Syntrophomonadaceae bacterium]|nr:hypothetical protein [Bacillota bacterium]
MKYVLETISPVHIGTGSTIGPIEYVVDDRFYRIDMDALFRDDAFDNESFIKQSMQGMLYLGSFDKNAHKRGGCIRYSVSSSNDVLDAIKSSASRGGRSAEVSEYIKTRDLPYIPGSSIKGAIRTAILWWVLKNDSRIFNKAIAHLERLLGSERRVDKKWVGDEIEKMVFGKDPTHDLLRARQISDTDVISIEKLKIEGVRTLTTGRVGHDWKQFHTFMEALKPETSLELSMHFDEFILKKDIAQELHIDGKQEYLRQIPKICNTFAEDSIKHEITFFKKYNNEQGKLDDVLAFYDDIKHDVGGAGEDSFLLHFAWGTGWYGMTKRPEAEI